MNQPGESQGVSRIAATRIRSAGRARPARQAASFANEVRAAEREVATRRIPALLVLRRQGRFVLLYADAIIAADVLGLELRFSRTHCPRTEVTGRFVRSRKPVRLYAIPTVELTTVEEIKELSDLSGYPVFGLNSPAAAAPQPRAKVVSIASIRETLQARRSACL